MTATEKAPHVEKALKRKAEHGIAVKEYEKKQVHYIGYKDSDGNSFNEIDAWANHIHKLWRRYFLRSKLILMRSRSTWAKFVVAKYMSELVRFHSIGTRSKELWIFEYLNDMVYGSFGMITTFSIGFY
ncbi:uncharacterized protein LOC126797594 [Argentina anserina]|uniref:uncharacterized protein LOC126797594 n=1 Tax=Argentina anserina TaxID=57926 RepID=UPI002176338B|nr:uncharacterized protein LOC126797594 [Potentilla anserina]XP_050380204.1 uncharacterized protein LOC126797594 [Potentilla anserina]